MLKADRVVRRRLGARIKQLRTARDLTQQTVADRLGMSQKYMSALECGQRSPSWDALVAIAHEGLEIKLASLMFGIDEDLSIEVQSLSDVIAGRPMEARGDLLRGIELVLRAGGVPK